MAFLMGKRNKRSKSNKARFYPENNSKYRGTMVKHAIDMKVEALLFSKSVTTKG